METLSERDRNQTGLIRLNLNLSIVKLTLHSSAVFNMKSMNIRSVHLVIQLVLVLKMHSKFCSQDGSIHTFIIIWHDRMLLHVKLKIYN